MGYDADGVFLGFFNGGEIFHEYSIELVVFIDTEKRLFFRSRRIPARGRPAVSVCGFRRRSDFCTARSPPFRQVVSRANAMKAGKTLSIIAVHRLYRFMVWGFRAFPGRDGMMGERRFVE